MMMAHRSTSPAESLNTRKLNAKQSEKSKGKQRAQVVEDSEEDQQQQQIPDQGADKVGQSVSGDEEDIEEESPRSKRRRTGVNGGSIPGTSLSGPLSQVQRKNVKTHPRGEDGYIPGSIVRIQLCNFVTYDYVQLFPGTHLNMIIGPNGTGKSSIACAIVLGLNFPRTVLGAGRANKDTKLGSFVKIGAEQGYIEIELKGPKGKKNLVIRRNLKFKSNSSSFTLNGSPATGREIDHKMAELNVQVGNLCSFLPQDRVSEFAAMSPQELLRETQRAAGDESLTSWHDTLINAGKDIREIQRKIRDEEDSLKQMKERNEGIEREVQRYKDRKRIEHEIDLLNVLVPVAEYRESLVKYRETKARQRKLHARVKALKEKNAPAHELLKNMEQNVKDIDKQRDTLKAATQAKFKQLALKNEASKKLQEKSSEYIKKLLALKAEETTRLKLIKSLNTEIKKLQEDIDKPAPPNLSSEEDLQNEVKQINLESESTILARDDRDNQLKAIIEKTATANVTLANARRELAKLDDADAQKLASMKRWDYTTYQAILWVRENRNLFKMEVFETPFMRVTVKDKKFINAVESTLSRGMKTFVTQCAEDCDTLNILINDEEKFGKGKKITTWFRPNLPHLHLDPPMTREELEEQNFDGYAMDYIDFPEGMRWYLQTLQLHRTAIASDDRRVNVGRVIELVGRPVGNYSGGAVFYAGKSSHSVTRSRYGIKALSSMTKEVKPARNLTAPTIDLDAQRRIQEEIRRYETELVSYEEEKRRINKEIDRITIEHNKFEERLANVKKKREDIKKEAKRLETAKAKLKAKQTSLTKLKNEPPVEHKRTELRDKLKVNADKRAEFAKEYTDLVHAIIFEQGKCTEAGLRYLQVNANKAALEDLCSRKDKKFQDALVLFDEVDKEFQAVRARSKALLEQTCDIIRDLTDEIKEEYQHLAAARGKWEEDVKKAEQEGRRPPTAADAGIDDRTVEELKDELEMQKARLSINLNANPGVVDEYEKRKRDIEVLEKTVEEKKRAEARIAKDIDATKKNWQPALQRLVKSIGAKFSAAFDRIGCAGEIQISEDEDFEKWAIDILVKFRDSERLQLLTAQRQSGGERSLTTILYLLSLTEEARAPFSLVDEINQGMDQRTERAVHNSMVNVTCQANSAQYFLITPKLLPDLEYDDRMKILCVNNGEWLPDVCKKGEIGNMMEMIDTFVGTRRQGRAGEQGRG